MAAQWPRVKARLVELLPTLAGWDGVAVFDGPLNTEAIPIDDTTGQAAWATVGYTSTDETGSYAPELALDGYRYTERGQVHGELAIQCGDVDAAPVIQARLYALLDALDEAPRADRTLGVLSQEGVASFAVVHLPPVPTNVGAAVIARFTCNYLTVTL